MEKSSLQLDQVSFDLPFTDRGLPCTTAYLYDLRGLVSTPTPATWCRSGITVNHDQQHTRFLLLRRASYYANCKLPARSTSYAMRRCCDTAAGIDICHCDQISRVAAHGCRPAPPIFWRGLKRIQCACQTARQLSRVEWRRGPLAYMTTSLIGSPFMSRNIALCKSLYSCAGPQSLDRRDQVFGDLAAYIYRPFKGPITARSSSETVCALSSIGRHRGESTDRLCEHPTTSSQCLSSGSFARQMLRRISNSPWHSVP